MKSYWTWLAAACLMAGRAGAQDDVVLRAMHDELDRTMSQLHVGQLEKPYFVSYRVEETQYLTTAALDGSLLHTSESHGDRHLEVEVRVGDYAFDNTNAMSFGHMESAGFSLHGFGGEATLPRDDNYREIRRQIWLATDAAYKQAHEALAAKRAAMLNRTERTTLTDFSHEAPTHTTDTGTTAPLPDRAQVESLAVALSRPMAIERQSPRATVATTSRLVRYINSEGTSYVVRQPLVAVRVASRATASDGMRLIDQVEWYARRFDALPPRDTLTARIATMEHQLDSLKKAPAFDHYDGPVLFDSHASAELFSAQFMPFLLAHRVPVIDNAQAEGFFAQIMGEMNALADKIGGRVLPDFMSVTDDPTATTAAGAPLIGGYVVDEEGVRARRTALIDSGYLETLLTTRTPVRGIDHSTGNRREGDAAPSNLIVTVKNGASDSTLVDRLLALVKRRGLPYGIIVRGMSEADASDPEAIAGMMGTGDPFQRPHGIGRAYRVYPDGHQELVRGVYLTAFNPSSFKDVLAASATPTVLTLGTLDPNVEGMMFGPELGFSGGRGGIAISMVVPALLFEDVSLTAGRGALTRPALSAPPT